MSLCISIRFLTGRAHLHHWHAHHSDGKVDWPPSPWRLLRALVAAAGTGLTSLPDPISEVIGDDRAADDALPISRLANLLALLAAPPKIWLPRTSGGHTRQFLPMKNKSSGSAVFDSFATLSKDTPAVFVWPDAQIASDDERFADLQSLLRRLTYFGRAESWCEAAAYLTLPPRIQPGVSHWCCVGLEQNEKPEGKEYAEFTIERKLAPELPLETSLRNQVAAILPTRDFKVLEYKTNKKAGQKIEKWANPSAAKREEIKVHLAQEPAGLSLLRCLLRSSGDDIKDGLERPVGSRWLRYVVPRAIYQVPDSRPPVKVGAHESAITLFRFALNTATINRPVLPLLTDTLLFADKFRAAALAWHGCLKSGEHPRNLCGREMDNGIERRVQGNDHAFFWPTDEDNDGFIDHVSVYCPRGFLTSESDALRRLLRIRQRGGRPDLLITPIFLGQADDYGPWSAHAKVFVSATPYFPPVHISHGRRQQGNDRNRGGRLRLLKAVLKSLSLSGLIERNDQIALVNQIVFESGPEIRPESSVDTRLKLAQFTNAVCLDPDVPLPLGSNVAISVAQGTRLVRALAFCRRRRNHIVESAGRFLRIEFAKPRVARPFAIGSQAHFGLGLFVPADAEP